MDEAARLITNPMPTGRPRDTPDLMCCRHKFWSIPHTDRGARPLAALSRSRRNEPRCSRPPAALGPDRARTR